MSRRIHWRRFSFRIFRSTAPRTRRLASPTTVGFSVVRRSNQTNGSDATLTYQGSPRPKMDPHLISISLVVGIHCIARGINATKRPSARTIGQRTSRKFRGQLVERRVRRNRHSPVAEPRALPKRKRNQNNLCRLVEEKVQWPTDEAKPARALHSVGHQRVAQRLNAFAAHSQIDSAERLAKNQFDGAATSPSSQCHSRCHHSQQHPLKNASPPHATLKCPGWR